MGSRVGKQMGFSHACRCAHACTFSLFLFAACGLISLLFSLPRMPVSSSRSKYHPPALHLSIPGALGQGGSALGGPFSLQDFRGDPELSAGGDGVRLRQHGALRSGLQCRGAGALPFGLHQRQGEACGVVRGRDGRGIESVHMVTVRHSLHWTKGTSFLLFLTLSSLGPPFPLSLVLVQQGGAPCWEQRASLQPLIEEQ